ncbi:hypothetical protein DVS28_b0232 (plasmid) [Euzebya pacifica]|uniref:Uncharacterized protein n=1 Tax=Euzebya pacifica TaxID=1608957 RepID=A0A346Y6A5_9ACTN|nr:hypothetical protein [Euzebya pacifica]AXV10002.1 hypothetical protein DVS28_b0232 [Euzebya pacifica]
MTAATRPGAPVAPAKGTAVIAGRLLRAGMPARRGPRVLGAVAALRRAGRLGPFLLVTVDTDSVMTGDADTVVAEAMATPVGAWIVPTG